MALRRKKGGNIRRQLGVVDDRCQRQMDVIVFHRMSTQLARPDTHSHAFSYHAAAARLITVMSVSYTHLTLPTNREV